MGRSCILDSPPRQGDARGSVDACLSWQKVQRREANRRRPRLTEPTTKALCQPPPPPTYHFIGENASACGSGRGRAVQRGEPRDALDVQRPAVRGLALRPERVQAVADVLGLLREHPGQDSPLVLEQPRLDLRATRAGEWARGPVGAPRRRPGRDMAGWAV